MVSETIIVTAGSSYMDVDAYACCIAYSELLRSQNINAIAYSSATFNYSISNTVLLQNKKVETVRDNIHSFDLTKFVLVDVSDPKFFDPIVIEDRVIRIFDHHVGFEDYWNEKLGNEAYIEFIGAASTLIFEEWKKRGLVAMLTAETAKIMVAGILDNTLNLSAEVTTKRDILAKNELCEIANIDEDWCSSYFVECQQAIEENLRAAIISDTKEIRDSVNLPSTIGQLAIWDAQKLLQNYDIIFRTMSELSATWLINVISIKDKKSYFICNNPSIQRKIESVFDVSFIQDIAIAERMWLRKEILRTAGYRKL